jgi:hypothetical protein
MKLYRSFRASPGQTTLTSSDRSRARRRRLRDRGGGVGVREQPALLAEAFHVLIDVVALGIALVALWLGTRPVTDRRTFGLLRLEILATVLNTVLLLIVAAVVLVEGVRRSSEPSQVQTGIVLAVAVVGLLTNGVSGRSREVPARRLRYRALDLPTRDRGSQAPRERNASVNGSWTMRGPTPTTITE